MYGYRVSYDESERWHRSWLQTSTGFRFRSKVCFVQLVTGQHSHRVAALRPLRWSVVGRRTNTLAPPEVHNCVHFRARQTGVLHASAQHAIFPNDCGTVIGFGSEIKPRLQDRLNAPSAPPRSVRECRLRLTAAFDRIIKKLRE